MTSAAASSLSGQFESFPARREPAWRRAATDKGLWTFVDQGVVSVANFACSVLVGRWAGMEEFGLYGLGFGLIVLLIAIAKSLVWTPLVSLSPRLPAADRRRYDANATVYFGLLALAIGAVLAAAGAAMTLVESKPWFARLFFVLAPCGPLLLFREHVRQLCLSRLQIGEVLAFDVTVSFVQIVALVATAGTIGLSGATAYLPMAAACVLGLVWLGLRRERFDWSLAGFRRDWARNWEISRWITPTAIMGQIGQVSYRWFLEALRGLGALGLLTSAQTVIQIANPLLLGNANFFGPRSAQIFAEQGGPGLWHVTVRNTRFLFGLVSAVVVGAWLFGPLFIRLAYGASYDVDPTLTVFLAGGMLSEVLIMPIDFAMLTLGRAVDCFKATAMRLALNLTLGLALVAQWGARGIGAGLLIVNCVALAYLWTRFAREVRGEDPTPSSVDPSLFAGEAT